MEAGDPQGAERRTHPAGERTDDDGAERRTSLAGERTLLAWWRTGLTAIAVAFGVGRIVPELAPRSTRWPYAVLGAAFAIYGIALFVLGTRRMGIYRRDAQGGSERSSEDLLLGFFLVGGVLLGIGTLAVIVTQ